MEYGCSRILWLLVVCWRIFLKALKGHGIVELWKPQKDMKIIYCRHVMIWKTSFWKHTFTLCSRFHWWTFVKYLGMGLLSVVMWSSCIVRLEWYPVWFLFPLLGGWLHRSLGWEVSLHGSYFCGVMCRFCEDTCHEVLGFHPCLSGEDPSV